MKTDYYTKTVLTIIAVCLSINVIQQLELVPKAHASTVTNDATKTEYRLVPVSESNTIDVRIVDVNTYDELNVNVKSIDTNEEMNVNLKGVDTQDELDINIDEVGGQWVSNGGPIKVKIDQR